MGLYADVTLEGPPVSEIEFGEENQYSMSSEAADLCVSLSKSAEQKFAFSTSNLLVTLEREAKSVHVRLSSFLQQIQKRIQNDK